MKLMVLKTINNIQRMKPDIETDFTSLSFQDIYIFLDLVHIYLYIYIPPTKTQKKAKRNLTVPNPKNLLLLFMFRPSNYFNSDTYGNSFRSYIL